MKNISFVLASGVSLGSYEAGVMTTFIDALYSQKEINIEIVGGASAGAITGFIFSYSLYKGINPYEMYNLWVNKVELRKMFNRNFNVLLSFDEFRKDFLEFININKMCEYEYNSKKCIHNRGCDFCSGKLCGNVKKRKIKLTVAMSNIESFVTYLTDEYMKMTIPVKIHKDSFIIDFDNFERYDINRIIDIIFSSAAMPGVFNSFNITKQLNEFEYEPHTYYSIKKFATNYSDGGSTNNLPLKNVFELNRNIEEIITIIPHPDNVFKIIENTNKNHGFLRIKSIFFSFIKSFQASLYQSFYNDLKLLFDTNKNIINIENFIKEIEKNFSKLDNEEKNAVKKMFNNIIDGHEFIKNLKYKIKSLSNVENKVKVKYTRISPINPEEDLSGEILGHFAGFLEKRLRNWDFHIGYFNGLSYLKKNNINGNKLFNKLQGDLGTIKYNDIKGKGIMYLLFFKYIVIMLKLKRKNPFFGFFYILLRVCFEMFYYSLNIKR